MTSEYHDANESSQWTKEGEQEKDRNGSFSSDVRRDGQFSESIESLGEILEPDQESKQRAVCTTAGESGSQSDGFRDEVEQHGHELSSLATTDSD